MGDAEQALNKTGNVREWPSAGQEYLWLKDRATVHWICCRSSFSFLPLALDFLGKQKVWIRRKVWRTPPNLTSLFTYWFSHDKLEMRLSLLVSLQPQQREARCWEQIRRTIHSHLLESKAMLSYSVALCD